MRRGGSDHRSRPRPSRDGSGEDEHAAAIRKAAEERAAKEKAAEEAKAASEKAFNEAVDAQAETIAMRKQIDTRRQTLLDRIQTASGPRREMYRAVADYCNKHVFSSDVLVPIDTAIEKAKTLFSGKRYADAIASFGEAKAAMETIPGAIERAEWRVAVTGARRAVQKASDDARTAYQGLLPPASIKAAAAAGKAGEEKRKAGDFKGAVEEFKRAHRLYQDAVALAPVVRAAHDEAKRTAQTARAARIAWMAFAKKEGIDGEAPAAGADALVTEAGAAAKRGDWGAAATLFRKAGKMYAALKQNAGADLEKKLAALQTGKPPLPAGKYPPGLYRHAVGSALHWLSRHQDDDGRWDADGFMKHDPKADQCDGKGRPLHDTGVTGLALACFLKAGFTDRAEGEGAYFNITVHRGLKWLRQAQAEDGCYGPRASHDFFYGHCMATIAMCEAARLTKDAKYRRSAQQGINFIQLARNPGLAWRYEPRGKENDTSITAWAVRALDAGRRAGLATDADAFAGAFAWVEKMTDPNFGQVGYNFPGGTPARPEGTRKKWPAEKSQSTTAAGIYIRLLTGKASGVAYRKGLDLILAIPPDWNPDSGAIDMYYWHMAMRIFRHPAFGKSASERTMRTKWEKSVRRAILLSQHQDGSGARTGSWDPIGVWGREGGRVYSTAILAWALSE